MKQLKWLISGAIFLLGMGVNAQIKGVVLDELKEPVTGASVVIDGTQIGAVTNFDGEFELEYDGAYPITLVIRFIGYADERVELNRSSCKRQSNLTLLKQSKQFHS